LLQEIRGTVRLILTDLMPGSGRALH